MIHQTNYHRWDSDISIIQGKSRQDLIKESKRILQFLSENPSVELKDLAYTLNCPLRESAEYRLCIVSNSLEELEKKLTFSLQRLQDTSCKSIKDRSGIYFSEERLSQEGTLAFLFPGEGSQYVNMLSDLCLHFPEVRACFDRGDRVFLEDNALPLPSQVLFPPPLAQYSPDTLSEEDLWQIDLAMTAVFNADHAIYNLLNSLEIQPQTMIGHSTGEFCALMASGAAPVKDENQLIGYCLALRSIYQNSMKELIPEAKFITVGGADPAVVNTSIEESNGKLTIAMDNCPNQIILCGSEAAINRALDDLQGKGAICSPLPFERAYHTPLYQPICEKLWEFFQNIRIVPSDKVLYSCATAQPYPQDPGEIRRLAIDQWARPIRFRETIEATFEAGVRIFVEVGPKDNLTGFVNDILGKRRYLAVPANVPYRSGITQLNHLIGLLAAHGVPMRLEHLYARRAPQRLTFKKSLESSKKTGKLGAFLTLSNALPKLVLEQGHWKPPSHAPTPSETAPTTSSGLEKPAQIQESPAIEAGEEPLQQDGSRSKIMQEYLQTMERFLKMQHEIMAAFLDRTDTISSEPSVLQQSDIPKVQPEEEVKYQKSPSSIEPFGLIVSSLIPGREVVATCRLDLDEDLFLLHHTIGVNLSTRDSTLHGLPIIPLTMSAEIMVQVASLLSPGKKVIAMKDVRTHRRIEVTGGQPTTLRIIAKRRDSKTREETEVKVINDADAEGSRPNGGTVYVEGLIIFGNEYPSPPRIDLPSFNSTGPYSLNPEEYYTELMFHGPSFRGVKSIDQIDENGVEGTLKVPPHTDLFRSHQNPNFLIDPVLLDAAGQLVGFWAPEHLSTGFVVSNIGFKALHIYGPFIRRSDQLKGCVQINLLDDGHLDANISVLDSAGRLLFQFVAWKGWRFFDSTHEFVKFGLSPCNTALSIPWPSITDLPSHSRFYGCRCSENGGEVWHKILAHIILSRREREIWLRLTGAEKRRREWLLGRLVAKDAVRLFLKEKYGMKSCPADIEIFNDEYGRPIVEGDLINELGCRLSISIVHWGKGSAAVAGECAGHEGVGIDVELLERSQEGLEEIAFTAEERTHLSAVPLSRRKEWLLRLWCSKEAVAKALGRGMVGNPRNLVVQDVDVETSSVTVRIAGELAQKLSDYADKSLTAYTGSDETVVFATSLV
jgi:phosphopantetheine--protein transferase-like protein